MRRLSVLALVSVALTGLSSPVLAHVGDHSGMGLIEALRHPFSSPDHILPLIALVTVGLFVVIAGLSWRRG